MDATGFFQSTVPVFRHYTSQLNALVTRLSDDQLAELSRRLAPDTFTAGEHFRTAQGFALRSVYPLIGHQIPDLSTDRSDTTALRQRSIELDALLSQITLADFAETPGRMISHEAGQAALTQDATAYLTLFALPNFYFHLTMGYATLRQGMVDIGKADFDGLHAYPKGFRFMQN